MARIWYGADGSIMRFAKNDQQEALMGVPAGAAGSVAFDETTNAPAIADIDGNWNAHTCPAGVLKKSGVNVTINADSTVTADRKGLLQNAAQAVTDNNTYLAIGSPSNAQVAAQVRALTQQMNRVIKRLARFTT